MPKAPLTCSDKSMGDQVGCQGEGQLVTEPLPPLCKFVSDGDVVGELAVLRRALAVLPAMRLGEVRAEPPRTAALCGHQ